MKRFIKQLILFSFCTVAFFLLAGESQAAVITISPQYRNISYGESFVVEARLNSEKEIVNAVQATITYPSNGKLLGITFQTKSSGSAEIGFSKSATSVHLNDAQGSATETEFISGIYQISPAVVININSSTHPDENSWYQNNSPIFEWNTKPEAVYSYKLSEAPDKLPDARAEIIVGEVAYTDLSDGIYYFILNERVEKEDWAVVGRRRVMIDTKPPLSFDIRVSSQDTIFDGEYFLAYTTTDLMSGIDYYEIIEGHKTYSHVTSPYLLKDQDLTKRIIVRAFDKAGNRIQASLNQSAGSLIPGASITILIIIGIIVIIIALLLVLFLMKKCRRAD